MSRRSSVCIALSHLVEIPPKITEALSDATEKYDDGESLYWYWSFVKWYRHEGEVKKIMEFLETLEEDDYAFVEISEDYFWEELGNTSDFQLSIDMVIDKPF